MNFPILSSLILLPTIGALFLFFTNNKEGSNLTIKYVALFASIVNFLISIYLWVSGLSIILVWYLIMVMYLIQVQWTRLILMKVCYYLYTYSL